MTTRSALPPQAALEAELAQIAALNQVIRAAQAEQFRRIESARLLAAEAEGVTDASSSLDWEFATRAFVAELATALVVHEATAGGLVADARRLTGAFGATLAALAGASLSYGRNAYRVPADLAGYLGRPTRQRQAPSRPTAARTESMRSRQIPPGSASRRAAMGASRALGSPGRRVSRPGASFGGCREHPFHIGRRG